MKKIIVTLLIILSVGLFAILHADMVYVLNSGSQTVTEINLDNQIVNNSFLSIGLNSNQIVVNNNRIWVVNSGDNNIKAYNRLSGAQEKTYTLDNSSKPWNMLETDDAIYVTGMMNSKLYRILKSDDSITTLDMIYGPEGMLLYNNKIYVVCSGYNSQIYYQGRINIVNQNTFTQEDQIDVPTNPQAIVKDNNNHIYVVSSGNYSYETGKLTKIDPSSISVSNIYDIGGTPNSIFISPDQKLYLGDGLGTGFYVFDTISQQFINNTVNPLIPGGNVIMFHDGNKYVLKSNVNANSHLEVYDSNNLLLHDYTCAIGAVDFKIIETGTSNNDLVIPEKNILSCYPNPFKDDVSIKSNNNLVDEITIYNIKGQKIISDKTNHLKWDGKNMTGLYCTNGIYFCVARSHGKIISQKPITLLK